MTCKRKTKRLAQEYPARKSFCPASSMEITNVPGVFLLMLKTESKSDITSS